MEYEAECCVWFTVKFTDNGTTALADQAHDAMMDLIDLPTGRINDAEVRHIQESGL